jgi:oxygen-independent coproporphyrinogen-3 oxidase
MISPVTTSIGRDGRWTADPGYGVYVHIPFCRHRCHYCDFNTYEAQDDLHDAYMHALIRDIERSQPRGGPATSIFFGGGTPTLMEPKLLGATLDAIRCSIGIDPHAEVTIEANPETVDERRFEALLAAGFDRVSIGIQSLVPHVLKGLGRTHDAATGLAAIRAARNAGFGDVNADLIYGSPWESPADWRASLEGLIEQEPDHISAYALTVEEGTPLGTLVKTGRVADVDPDVQADRHGLASALLEAAGYERYEISNWSRPGRASRHNVLYWSGGDYAGFGAGAHGHLSGRRSWTIRLPRNFIEAVEEGRSVEAGHEVLDPAARGAEALMLGLRLRSGVEMNRFAATFGPEILDSRRREIEDLEALGLVRTVDGWLRLDDSATMICNEVLSRLL